MIRIEITRRLDCKQGKGRNRINPNIVSCEATEKDAVAHIRDLRIAGEEIAPGYMPITGAKLYDFDAFQDWARNGGDMPKALRVISAEEVAAL